MISDKEKKLIIGLRKNRRNKISSIAKEYNYPVSTIADMLHRLERKGIVEHTSKVSFEKIGYPVRMFIAIKIDLENRENLKKYLEGCKNINNLHVVNGGFNFHNFHFEAIFRNQIDAYHFLDRLELNNKIIEKNVYNVIDTIHSEKFLTEEEHFE